MPRQSKTRKEEKAEAEKEILKAFNGFSKPVKGKSISAEAKRLNVSPGEIRKRRIKANEKKRAKIKANVAKGIDLCVITRAAVSRYGAQLNMRHKKA